MVQNQATIMQYNVEGTKEIFSQITLANSDQSRLIDKLTKILNRLLVRPDFVNQIKTKISVEHSVFKKLQECYDIFKKLRGEIVMRNVHVPKTHLAGSLISRRIISVASEGEERINALRGNDERRTELCRERRDKHKPI